MNAIDEMKSKIDLLKSETESILLSPHSINERQYDYDWANFPNMILFPFMDHVQSSIYELRNSEILIKKLESWIEELKVFLEDDLHRIATKKNYRYQISYIRKFITKLSSLKNELVESFNNEDALKEAPKTLTDLTKNETVLLMLYLQEAKAIKSYGILENEDLCQAFSIITGYSKGQLTKSIAGKVREEKNTLTAHKKNYDKLKELLHSIISSIDSDIASFH